jgi:hypothetical protein
VQQVQHRRVRPDLQDLGLVAAGLPRADRVGGRRVPPAEDLLGLLVQRPSVRLPAFERCAGRPGNLEPGRPDLDRRVLRTHLVPAHDHLGAVPDAERVGHLRRRGLTSDGRELLPVPGGEIGVVAAVHPVPAAGQAVEAAAGAADVRAGAGLRNQDALDAELVDGALDGLLGHPEHLRHGRDGGQPLTRLPVTAPDAFAQLSGDLPVWKLGGARVNRHGMPLLPQVPRMP